MQICVEREGADDAVVEVAGADTTVGGLRAAVAAAFDVRHAFVLKHGEEVLEEADDQQALADVGISFGDRVEMVTRYADVAQRQLEDMEYKLTRDGLNDAVYHKDFPAVACFAALLRDDIDDEIVYHLLGSFDCVDNFSSLLVSVDRGRAASGLASIVDELFDIGKLDQRTLLHHVCSEGNNLFWGSNAPAVARTLVAHGADITKPDTRGNAPLHYAVALHETAVLRALVDPHAAAQPGLEPRDNLGRTPLNLAVSDYRYEQAELLLTSGADPNTQDATKSTPLHKAMMKDRGASSEALIALLVQHGARADVTNSKRKTPAEVCRSEGLVAALERAVAAVAGR